ncbi:hypothetical protein O1L60_47280 [Streptomyces diastatochromogenes]|nr:hypothetical protein [Streptomyces diastatochromogenes]
MIVAFEPCGATRVRVLGARMGAALAAADEVVLLPVRNAVPSQAGPAAGDEIEEAAVGAGAHVFWVDGLAQAVDAVAALAAPGDVVLTMGVGAVAGLGRCCWRPRTGP